MMTTAITDKNFKDVERAITVFAKSHMIFDEDGNLDFEETVHRAARWALMAFPYKTAYEDNLESTDDWFEFIISRFSSLRDSLENFLLK